MFATLLGKSGHRKPHSGFVCLNVETMEERSVPSVTPMIPGAAVHSISHVKIDDTAVSTAAHFQNAEWPPPPSNQVNGGSDANDGGQTDFHWHRPIGEEIPT